MNPLLKFYINALEGAGGNVKRNRRILACAVKANGLSNEEYFNLRIVDDELSCRCFNGPVMIGD